MATTAEINALLHLIEDPDEEVFLSVSERFVGLGKETLTILEDFKNSSPAHDVQEKTQTIIFKIKLDCLSSHLREWQETDEDSLIEPSLFIADYINIEAERETLLFELEKIRKSVWLELNNYLTPLEEINIINKIIFGYYKFKGKEITYANTSDFDLYTLLTAKTANSFPIATLYLIVGEMLGIAVRPVDIPKQNLLCYLEKNILDPSESRDEILFYIDPSGGHIYTQNDIETYLKKIDYFPHPMEIKPISNIQFLANWLQEISKSEKANGNNMNALEIAKISENFRDPH
jgi:regulator of sirC expression with transglutaminase-like and TPR domain